MYSRLAKIVNFRTFKSTITNVHNYNYMYIQGGGGCFDAGGGAGLAIVGDALGPALDCNFMVVVVN